MRQILHRTDKLPLKNRSRYSKEQTNYLKKYRQILHRKDKLLLEIEGDTPQEVRGLFWSLEKNLLM